MLANTLPQPDPDGGRLVGHLAAVCPGDDWLVVSTQPHYATKLFCLTAMSYYSGMLANTLPQPDTEHQLCSRDQQRGKQQVEGGELVGHLAAVCPGDDWLGAST